MKFEGFEAPNQHFTTIPNQLIELILQSGVNHDPRNPDKPVMGIGEIKILLFMFRQTFGWQRGGSALEFSFNDLTIATFLGRATINTALKRLLEKEYIQRAEIDGKFLYRLNLLDYNDYPWTLSTDWKKTFRLDERKEQRFGNRTSASSETEPVPVRKPNQTQFGNRTNEKAESIGAVEEKQALKKGLKKGLKKDLNKKHLSEMESEIEQSKLPDSIKTLLRNKIDRLLFHSINVYQIENHFLGQKLVDEFSYSTTLEWVLDLNNELKIGFSAFMTKSIERRKQEHEEANIKATGSNRKATRKEVLPSYIKPMNYEQSQKEEVDINDLENELREYLSGKEDK